jgi:hypothetical protein
MWLKQQYLEIRKTHFYCRNSVLYAGIPKNSSSYWRTKVFPNSITNIDNCDNIEYAFAVIREPHERLISGITEWIKRSSRREQIITVLEDFDQLAVDTAVISDINYHAHLMPQHYFVAEYDFTLINFNCQIPCADHLEQEYNLKKKNIKNKPSAKYDYCDHDLTKHIVKKYYAQDVALWQKVNEAQ